MYEKLIELLEPYMSGEPCDAESGSCELTNCRTCDAIALANRLIFHDVVPVVRCKDCKKRNTKKCPLVTACIDIVDGEVVEVIDQKRVGEDFWCKDGVDDEES